MTKPTPLPTLEFKTPASFETWLEKNHTQTSGFWLKIFKKGSGQETITYAEALDVALCYGWIDGQKQSYDDQAWLQKFSPRRAKSIWSKVNIGHVERLIGAGRMKTAGFAEIERAKADGRWEKAYEPSSKMTIPDDFLQELSKNQEAETFFKTLNKTNLFMIGFKLQSAKKPETRSKRMREIIDKLARGEKLQ
ncbi:MAG: YdeI/OmpD-associated family protein [Bacteroidia bacterium]|nr:YdeI/OmpD-associated family protein [Bacteroidia bacterium]